MQKPDGQRNLGVMAVAAGVVVMAVLGYRFWYQPGHDYVEVEDAVVTGELTRIPAPAAGRVREMLVRVGDHVRENDRVASVRVASSASGQTDVMLAEVLTPMSGAVAALWVNAGESVSAGQPVVSVVDLDGLWVIADVDEGRIAEVHIGQAADIRVTGIPQTFQGMVTSITPATTEVLNAQANGAPASSDMDRRIPVRIDVRWGDTSRSPLAGMTADVVIHVD